MSSLRLSKVVIPDYWSNLISSIDLLSRIFKTDVNLVTSSSFVIDDRKTVKVLKAETLTWMF